MTEDVGELWPDELGFGEHAMLFRDMNDFRDQISSWSIGSLRDMMSKVGGMGPMGMEFPFVFEFQEQCNRFLGIIDSMTPAERGNPLLLDGPRRRRIAAGSGVEHPDVCQLLDLFDTIADLLEQQARDNLNERFRNSTGSDDVEFLL